jgi:hypothetical protein
VISRKEGQGSQRKKTSFLPRSIGHITYQAGFRITDYANLLEAKGTEDIKNEDWSYIIVPFRKVAIKSTLSLCSIVGLMRSGLAYTMLLILRGFKIGLIKFGRITCTIPVN